MRCCCDGNLVKTTQPVFGCRSARNADQTGRALSSPRGEPGPSEHEFRRLIFQLLLDTVGGTGREFAGAESSVVQSWRREERPAAQVYGGLCSGPFHSRHFDELLEDVGAKKRNSANNPGRELFLCSNKATYGQFLASASQHHAAGKLSFASSGVA